MELPLNTTSKKPMAKGRLAWAALRTSSSASSAEWATTTSKSKLGFAARAAGGGAPPLREERRGTTLDGGARISLYEAAISRSSSTTSMRLFHLYSHCGVAGVFNFNAVILY